VLYYGSARRGRWGQADRQPKDALMSQPVEVDDLADRLVSVHGEGGLSPTAAQWREILAGPARELQVLTLFKFVDQVETPTGTIPGLDAYRRYTSRIAGPFSRAGGRVGFFANVGHTFALATDPSGDWDAAVLTRYPTPDAFAQLWLDPAFVSVHVDRVDGSQVLFLGA
jgi:hypothetical protein